MDGKELFEAIDNEIIAAGGSDRIAFTVLPIAPELLDQLVGKRVEIAGIQRKTGRLPGLLLRTLE